MKIKIEKGVPLPPKRAPRGAVLGAFMALEVGDSLLLPMKYRSNGSNCAKRAGIKIVARKAGKGKFRVWRTA
jgi:hypothetical protein